MADKSIILHSELDSLDKYKNGKSITSTEKKKTIGQLLHIFHTDNCRKGEGSRGEFLTKSKLNIDLARGKSEAPINKFIT